MELFELNSKIELISDDDETTYGLIHDIVDDKIYVSITVNDPQIRILHKGDIIRCIVFNGSTGTEFAATITDRISGEFSIYELSNLKDFNEIQRRNDVRVQYTVPLHYTKSEYLSNLDIEYAYKHLEKIRRYFLEGMTSDLSAGGVKFSCSQNFTNGQVLLHIFNLDKDSMIIKGRIMHKEIKIVPKNTIYTYGIQFIDITEQQSEKIIRFLFVLMRRNRIK